MNITQENLTKMLNENICDLTFYKKDGTVRKMLATRLAEHIPVKEDGTPSTRVASKNESLIQVIDVDLNDWRAFIYENLIDCKIASN